MTSNIPVEIVNVVQQVVIIMIAAKGLLAGPQQKAIVANAKRNAELQAQEAAAQGDGPSDKEVQA
jgi:hypothetical protein